VSDAALEAMDDHEVASRLATEAGEFLVALRTELFASGQPSWRIGDEGDAGAHHYLVQAISRARPGDAILSEEGRDSRNRLSHNRVWIIDPVDGTNEFGERGRDDWAVHVALVEDGELVAAAVALPAISLTLSTRPAPVVPPTHGRAVRVVTSRFHVPRAAVVVARALGADVVHLGSAGAKAMAVVLGEADLYAHHGGMYEWDSAAPVAVARAAGLHVSRIDGSPLEYNQPDPWLPDLLICRPELAEPALAALWG
jgi:3'(2'), 5'-bisphosphate nucleotidase